MNDISVAELKDKAKELRKLSVQMVHEAQSGHPGGSLSAADMVAALYFREMNTTDDPHWPDRDRFLLSKGHVAPVLYSVLMLKGYVPMENVHTLRKLGSPFQGHPDSKKCVGVEISTGSLGQGLSPAVGMALAGKRDGRDYRVFALLGDGEIQEGQIWEALQCAHSYKLDNLVVIIDENNLQIDGFVSDIAPNLDIRLKLEAFGYEAYTCDGHDMDDILATLEKCRERNGKPKGIVMKTVKGKGVDYMENQAGWHGKAPNDEQYADAMAQLEKGLDK